MIELFLAAALALPATFHKTPAIVAMGQEEKDIRDLIERHHPGAEVFIHDNPQEDKLREHGWERVPFNWRGKQVWIQRVPRTDDKPKRRKGLSASA